LTVSRATSASARLQELAQRHALSPRQREQLGTIVAELEADTHAPSAVRAAESAVDIHIADSLSALDLPGLAEAEHLVDIGSGAGFPGLPLAVALPLARVSLVESQARKCAFLRRLCRMAGIANVEVICARVEEWQEGRERCDVALARAVGPPSVVLEYAAPPLRVGGRLVDWRGHLEAHERVRAETAAGELGLELSAVREVAPFPGASALRLYLYLKVRATPERFPRRPGMASKRPLGQAVNGS
jgi:16S rRNA (guanine527-N7)-methyltransferase